MDFRPVFAKFAIRGTCRGEPGGGHRGRRRDGIAVAIEKGGAAGHNGMRDIIANLGDQFWRLRIGIGHPGDRAAVLNFVLGRASAEDSRLIDDAISAGLDVLPTLLSEGGQKAMHRLHTRNVSSNGGGPSAP